jgi:cysteine desulfurase family protein (TIGR01976 family)
MSGYDVDALRREFPALDIEQDGLPVALFDGPGGTQVPTKVIDAVAGYYRTANANTGGAFLTSERSDAIVAEAHAAMADFLGAANADEIKFGPNMTTLTLHVSRSIGATMSAGDEIVVTTLDHDANVSPWRHVAADRGLTLTTVDIRADDCTLDLDGLDRALERRPKLVAFGYASNAVGSINPVAELVRRVHDAGAWTYVDAVHYAPHGSIDVAVLETDFLACSAYKFFGPHQGILYGRAGILEALPTYKLRPAHDRFETGTQSFESIAGTLAALDYLVSLGQRFGTRQSGRDGGLTNRRPALVAALDAIRGYELGLWRRLAAGLEAIPGVRLWGIADPARDTERTPTAAITIEGTTPRAAAAELGRRGIATWDGDFYATGLIERLGQAESGGVLRVGLVHYNTEREVDRLLEAIDDIASAARAGEAATAATA